MTEGKDFVTIADLWVATPIDPWLNLGLMVQSDSFICVPDLGLRFVALPRDAATNASSIVGWTLIDPALGDEASMSASPVVVDGITTAYVSKPTCSQPLTSPLGILGVDHVVVMTGQLERTCTAITTATRAPLKRIRDAGGGVRQGFHRCGRVIIEVVERPDIDAVTPASIWGLVLTVQDLDEVMNWLGPDAVSAARPAVQAGRKIATIKSEAGLGVAVALMTPEPAR